MDYNKIIEFSEDRSLFIIYNQDTSKDGKKFITMKGIDNGKLEWEVSKFMLYSTDKKDGFSASPAQFIQNILGYKSAVFICKDLITIGRSGVLFQVGNVLKKYGVEILMLPSNWQYNYPLVEDTMQTPLKYLKSIITEQGIMTPRDIEQYIKNLNIHRTFSD